MTKWLTGAIAGWPIACQMLLYFALLAIGVVALVKFCDLMVDNASGIAKKAHISPMIIGLTIVAIGTSCPELAVSVSNSIEVLIKGAGDANIAIGNVIGSNTCNLLLVLGFSCVFTPIAVKRSACRREFPFLLGITGILVLFTLLFSQEGVLGHYTITRWEGIILVVLIPVYIFFLIHNAKKHPEDAAIEMEEASGARKEKKLWLMILLAIVGALGVALGGECVTLGAQGIALEISDLAGVDHGTAELVIGLTVVAVGTSLPELVASTMAAKRGENEMALGNVIGSNIFNTIFVLGIAATIYPLGADEGILVDAAIMLGATLLVFFLSLFRGKISRASGGILLGIYACYVAYLVTRVIITKA